MKYGPLGRSGLIVSRICLGGNSWGAKGRRGWGKFDEAEAPAYFKRALDVGWAQLLEVIPHTEGLRLITSSAAVFDQHFHATKVGR